MAILMDDLLAALVNAGATEELAGKAATYEARLAGVETRPSVLTWMSGATLAMCITILFRVFY